MTENRRVYRKSTLTQISNREPTDSRKSLSPANRITSMKNLSFEDCSFSEHIFFNQQSNKFKNALKRSNKCEDFTSTPKTDNTDKNFWKSCKQQINNPFLLAKRDCELRSQLKLQGKLQNTNQQAKQEFLENNITTFRLIKKKSLNEQPNYYTVGNA